MENNAASMVAEDPVSTESLKDERLNDHIDTGAAGVDVVSAVTATPADDTSSKSRSNQIHFSGAVLFDGPHMYRSFFRAYLPEKTKLDWNEGQLWKQWCQENYDAIKNYRCFKQQMELSEHVDGKYIPIFEKCDVQLFDHVIIKKVDKSHVKEASQKLKSIRNRVAHQGGLGLNDEEFEESFNILKSDVIQKMFKDYTLLQDQWLDWMNLRKKVTFDETQNTKLKVALKKLARDVENLADSFENDEDEDKKKKKAVTRPQLKSQQEFDATEFEAKPDSPNLLPMVLWDDHGQAFLVQAVYTPSPRPGQRPQTLSVTALSDDQQAQIKSGHPIVSRENDGIGPEQIQTELVLARPCFQYDSSSFPQYCPTWSTADRFFIGADFVAIEIDGQILFWGGGQVQPGSRAGVCKFLPSDIVFILLVESFKWKVIEATGDIPQGAGDAAFAALNGKAYLFGGSVGTNQRTNEIYSLTITGEFQRLSPNSDAPSPREAFRGWSFKGKLYFFGGAGEKGIGGDWVQRTSLPATFYNNQLIQFDPEQNVFSLVPTKGRPPSPRASYAAAQLEEKVFIHGGSCDDETCLNDFFELNMETRSWSSLAFGLSAGIRYHNFSPISSSQFLLVGGQTPLGLSKEVFVYDSTNSNFTQIEDLPSDFCGDGGLVCHRVVSETKENRIKRVFCFGGFINENLTQHAQHIIRFNLPDTYG